MSVLKRPEEEMAPSWPLALTSTVGLAATLSPDTPAINAWVCALPIRIVPDSPATPWLAMSTLTVPLVRAEPAF